MNRKPRKPMNKKFVIRLHALLAAAVLPIAAGSASAQPPPPPPPPPPAAVPLPAVSFPTENPSTESKRVLGKILFWDEQLSVDGTMACATCHSFANGGGDLANRRIRTAGPDGVTNTADDVFGSPGVIRSDSFKDFVRDATFGTNRQVTARNAMSPINAAFATDNFWDGRARTTFTDPQTGQVSITNHGGLESQVVGPPSSSIEMGHDGVNWAEIDARLTSVKPLALGTAFPTDVSAALASHPTYPQLFQQAFGDAAISADRVAKAIATYERTLIANQTPYDTNTLTQNQRDGFSFFIGQGCNQCHTAPMFSDQQFHNIGLRPPTEDPGRMNVTGVATDLGRMKTPSLRNVGLRKSYMHNGIFTTIPQVFAFYNSPRPGQPGSQQFGQNQDPLMAGVTIPPGIGGAVDDFISNGLTDPRVAAETSPFDHPTLSSRRPGVPPTINLNAGTPGTGNLVPAIIAVSPPMLGSTDFRVGLTNALGGANARLVFSFAPPFNGRLNPVQTFDTKTTSGAGAGNGMATYHWPLTGAGLASGQSLFAQWIVTDPAAAGGQAFSTVASFTLFCGSAGCPTICATDYNGDGVNNVADIFAYLSMWFALDPRADFDHSNVINVADVFAFLTSWFAGC